MPPIEYTSAKYNKQGKVFLCMLTYSDKATSVHPYPISNGNENVLLETLKIILVWPVIAHDPCTTFHRFAMRTYSTRGDYCLNNIGVHCFRYGFNSVG